MEVLKCRVCGEHKLEVLHRKFARSYKKKQGTCLKCHSDYSAEMRRVARAERKPYAYLTCSDCHQTFSKCAPYSNKNQFASECRYCASTNIKEFCPCTTDQT